MFVSLSFHEGHLSCVLCVGVFYQPTQSPTVSFNDLRVEIARGGHGNPLQYSCLENPTDRRAWWATVHGITKS